MRLVIDDERCEGHGRCYSIAGDLFEPDEIGNGVVRRDGTVPAGREREAELAVENCPEQAISLVED
ncbi:MAG TPA: ferredoxin, partial [Microthrixaceae bacterium]|nr:ferredoxin [Microthrixaceae bacterium]HNI36648.1 ferredoxin [Microthrixaceae bacterium]